MPASNQLLDGAMLRTEISNMNLIWQTGDPGTTTLPNNRIITWSNYIDYILMNGAFSDFSLNYCPNYSTMISYRQTVPAPSGVSAYDNSYCDRTNTTLPTDPGEPVYRAHISWTNGNSSYPVNFEYSSDGSAWYNADQATAGATSLDVGSPITGVVYFRLYHINSGIRISGYSSTVSVTINTLSC